MQIARAGAAMQARCRVQNNERRAADLASSFVAVVVCPLMQELVAEYLDLNRERAEKLFQVERLRRSKRPRRLASFVERLD